MSNWALTVVFRWFGGKHHWIVIFFGNYFYVDKNFYVKWVEWMQRDSLWIVGEAVECFLSGLPGIFLLLKKLASWCRIVHGGAQHLLSLATFVAVVLFPGFCLFAFYPLFQAVMQCLVDQHLEKTKTRKFYDKHLNIFSSIKYMYLTGVWRIIGLLAYFELYIKL